MGFIQQMSSRVRSPRERRMAVSHSEPASRRTPLFLPTLKARRPTFYEELIVSPDFIDITARKGGSAHPSQPQNSCVGSSRNKIFLQPSSPNRGLLGRLAEQDRVVQRYEEEQEEYGRLMERIRQKSLGRQRRLQKNNLSLIYQRLMGIM